MVLAAGALVLLFLPLPDYGQEMLPQKAINWDLFEDDYSRAVRTIPSLDKTDFFRKYRFIPVSRNAPDVGFRSDSYAYRSEVITANLLIMVAPGDKRQPRIERAYLKYAGHKLPEEQALIGQVAEFLAVFESLPGKPGLEIQALRAKVARKLTKCSSWWPDLYKVTLKPFRSARGQVWFDLETSPDGRRLLDVTFEYDIPATIGTGTTKVVQTSSAQPARNASPFTTDDLNRIKFGSRLAERDYSEATRFKIDPLLVTQAKLIFERYKALVARVDKLMGTDCEKTSSRDKCREQHNAEAFLVYRDFASLVQTQRDVSMRVTRAWVAEAERQLKQEPQKNAPSPK